MTHASILALVVSLAPTTVTAETLREAMSSAYRYNPRLDAERARLRATDEEVARANSFYRPTIIGSADVTRLGTNVAPDVPLDRDTQLRQYGHSVSLVQPLFRGFRTRNQVAEAEALVRAGRETLRDVEQAILLETVTAYMDVVRDQAIVRLRENNVAVLTRELRATEARFSVGEVTRTDVAQARARRAGSISALDLARSNLKTSRATFERVVGHPPRGLRDGVPHSRLLPKSLQQAVGTAARENPVMVGALYREQGSRHTVDRIRGELLPEVRLEAGYSFRTNPSTGTDYTETGTVVGRVTMPFYTNGEVEARVRQAKQTHISRLQEIEQARSEVQARVTSSWAQLEATRAQLVSDQAQVDASRIALNGVREEEKVGQRTILDVLNAEQELLNAEVNLVGTRRNVVVASYTLLSAIGKMTVVDLGVVGKAYDPEANYEEVRRKWFGISITHEDGRHERLQVAPPVAGPMK